MKKTLIAVAAAGILGTVSFAEEATEMVVSATRLTSRKESIANSVTLIQGKQLGLERNTTVIDVLKETPGVHIVQSGGMGTAADVLIRGSKSEHVLVVVDGVEINDAVAPGRSAYLANLDLENIERIEVLRGVQSGVYGSDAMGGVISITTKKGKKGVGGHVSFEGGSFATFKESAAVSGGGERYNYSLAVTRIDSKGISAADEDDGNTEEDGFMNTTASARLGLVPEEGISLDLVARFIDSENDFDNGGGPGGDAEDNVSKRRSFFFRAQGGLDLLDAAWHQDLGVSFAMHDRESESDFGASEFDSHSLKVDWLHQVMAGEKNRVIAGVEYEQEEGKTDLMDRETVGTISGFVQDQVAVLDDLDVNLSVRIDDHEAFGSEWTYRAGAVYRIADTGCRLKATYGTGFKAPSIYQLYAPATGWGAIGNEDLDPEKSAGWDAGIEQTLWEKKAMAGVNVFGTEFDDLIDFDNGYVNRSEASISGVEVFGRIQVTEDLSARANYTYTETEDKDTGKDLIRRPPHRVSAVVSYEFLEKGSVDLSVLHVSERDDRFYDPNMFTTVDTETDAYTVVNIAVYYDVTEYVRVFGRVDNLFDEDYQDAVGYGTPGISGYGGVKVTL